MAKITRRNVRWDPSTSPDVVAHKVYWCEEDNYLDYNISPSVRVDLPKTNLIIPDETPDFPTDADGNFRIGVTAADEVGNESDFIEVGPIPFDFAAPDAPKNLVVEDA